ncbi:hypothetical protein Hanom_Chr16g01443561 [Helianthus anomalus]
METLELVQKVVVLLICLSLSWRIIRYIWSFADVEKDPLIVLVTGAAGMSLINSSSYMKRENDSFFII